MTPFPRKALFALAALAVLAALSYWWQQRHPSPAAPEEVAAPAPTKVIGRTERTESRASTRLGTNHDDSPRAQELKRLKQKWMDLDRKKPGSGIMTPEHHALAQDTVDSLMCSEELIALLEFLEKNRASGRLLIHGKVANLFLSPRAAEAREMLAALPVNNSGIPPRQHWSFDAGFGCPQEEFASFCESLQDERAVQNAVFGRAKALVKTDPAAAISMALDALGNEVSSTLKSGSLRRLLADLPADTNFQELEQLLPPDSSEGERTPIRGPVRWGREELLRSWAKVDPAAAANHVLSNRERIDPEGINPVATEVAKKSPAAAIDWVQQFPEGPYFDQAAYGAIVPSLSLHHPQEARDLASMISDKKLREYCLQRIVSAGKSEAR